MLTREEIQTSTRFQKGHATWNKGKPHKPAGSERGYFKPGNKPPQTSKLGDGAITVRDKRSPRLYVRLALGKWAQLHYVAWEQVRGPVPPGHVLRCRTTNPLDPAPENWELLSRAENARRNEVGTSNTPAIRLTDAFVAATLSWTNKQLRELLSQCQPLLEVKRQQLLLTRALRQSHEH